VLEGESEEELERMAAEHQRLAQQGMVKLRCDGRVYYKHIDDLTREDIAARTSNPPSRVRILLGMLVHHEYTTVVRYRSVHSGTGKTGSAFLCGFVNSNERW
jgi:hypothetical protein